MTTIVLVRHGEVEGIDPPRFRGRDDLLLTPRGERQAGQTRDAIGARWALDAVYSSPLTRCVHTADVIAQPHKLDTVQHPGLIDIDYGKWQGLAETEVTGRWPEQLARWHTAPHTVRPPGGETLQEALALATDALHDILQEHNTHATLAIIAHDSINRLLLGHMLGLPVSGFWALSQSPCGINTIGFSDGRFVVHSINETRHLSE